MTTRRAKKIISDLDWI